MDGFPGYGKFQAEGSTFAWSGAYVDFAGVLFNDAVAHRKTQPGAPSGGLGCKEWIENTVEVLGRNPRARVSDFDLNGTVLRSGAHFEQATLRHGVARVHEEIEKDLLQAGDGTQHRRQLLVVILDDIHPRGLKGMLDERKGFFQHVVDIHFDEFSGTCAREIQEVVDDLAGAESLLNDAFDGFLARIVRGNLLGEHLNIIGNHGERRIHFVRDAGGEQAQRSEFLGLDHLIFQAHALGDVVEKYQAAQARAIFADQRRDGRVDHQVTAGARIQAELVDARYMIAGGARSDFGHQILRQHFRQAALQRFGARNGEQILELRIPGFDAIFQIHSDDANLE